MYELSLAIPYVRDKWGAEPSRSHADDAAFDLRATCMHVLHAGDRGLVETGLELAIPEGHAGLILPRSGLALKHGVTVLNAPGLIDPGYRGRVGVVLHNTSQQTFYVEVGDRVAQLLVVRLPDVEFTETFALPAPASERGVGGFGSSGVK